MSLFPIVTRELRVSSRRGATYWTRVVTALGALLVATFAWMVNFRSSAKDTGLFLFVSMSIVAYAHCLISGLVSTSDSLSEEKREGTLGLLFLTDLKGYDVVFGKLVASSLNVFYGLLAIFPVLGIAMLLGGVAVGEFARVMLVCVNCLFLSMSVGILCSSLCRDERKSMTLAFLIILALTAGLPALGGWIASEMRLSYPPMILFGPSPGYACFMAFDATMNNMPRGGGISNLSRFYQSVCIQHCMAWGAVMLACRIVPRSWQDKALSTGAENRRATWRQWAFGAPQIRVAFRRHLVRINPYYWLASRDRFKQTVPWLWLLPFAGMWLLGLVNWPNDWRDPGAYITTAILLHGLFKNLVAMEAARCLGADRRSGAMELLLCTPLQPRDIVRGQWLALFRQFGVPVLLVLLVDVIFFFAGFPVRANDRAGWIVLFLAGMSVFVLDLFALAAMSMWYGLQKRRSNQASLQALTIVGVLPWMGYLAFIAAMAVLEEVFQVRVFSKIEAPALIAVWWALSAAVAVLWGWASYRRLLREFRDVVAERQIGLGATLGRKLGEAFARWRAK
jgi:ABC-type transport system involved in multi-copper enzyme maturation permease subunit